MSYIEYIIPQVALWVIVYMQYMLVRSNKSMSDKMHEMSVNQSGFMSKNNSDHDLFFKGLRDTDARIIIIDKDVTVLKTDTKEMQKMLYEHGATIQTISNIVLKQIGENDK